MTTTAAPGRLGVPSATALYVGAVLGPGVLLLPALAAEAAGPASIVAWAGLLALSVPLAITFAALGVRHPVAGGTAAYGAAAFGPRVGTVTAWWFLAGVLLGAPAVSLIGGTYVAELTGGGRPVALAAGAAMFAAVLAANAAGARSTARVQLVVAALLAALLVTAIGSTLPAASTAPLTPFAPNGWLAVGTAASLLVFSFVGWEAVTHLVGELRTPARDLPRAIGAALAIVTVLYLGLAVATVTVLGAGAAGSDVPLADLVERGLGPAGAAVTAVVAVLLTCGAMNAYVAGSVQLGASLGLPGHRPLVLIGAVGTTGLALLAAGVGDVDAAVRATSACFVAVYVTGTAAGARLLRGGSRAAALVALGVVLGLVAFSGPFAAVPFAVAAAALLAQRPRRASAR